MSRFKGFTIVNLSVVKMRYPKLTIVILSTLILGLVRTASADTTLRLSPGFVYKLKCEGKLLISAVGDDSLIQIEALPKEIGCASVLKPLRAQGTTNLILETTTGTITRMIEVSSSFGKPSTTEFFLNSGGVR